ncbi:MAG TPA: hypothetical protein VH701_08885 [Vicinamibacterales bacterium]
MVTLAAQTSPLTQRASDQLQKKITLINENARAKQPLRKRTAVTEAEVNSYLKYAMAGELPTGVTEPQVTIEGGGRLSGRAVVDLSQVKAERSSGRWLDPLSYLGGKAPVTAVGVLRTSQGTAKLELESTTISGVVVPKMLLQALVSYYSRSAEDPDGFGLDDSFQLPAGIKEIEVGKKGEAVVVQ